MKEERGRRGRNRLETRDKERWERVTIKNIDEKETERERGWRQKNISVRQKRRKELGRKEKEKKLKKEKKKSRVEWERRVRREILQGMNVRVSVRKKKNKE